MSRNERGVYYGPDGKKTFVPLENNPIVFTGLAQKLGLTPQITYHDIYSLSSPDLLASIPRPIHALIFLAPAAVYQRVRAADTAAGLGTKGLTYDKSGADEPVLWFQQTIGHACGLVAFIHSIANGGASAFLSPESVLGKIVREAAPLKPAARAEVLYRSDELEEAHMAVAFDGSSVAPLAAEPNGFHFISFVSGKDGHLYELEGGWDGPIDRGMMGEGEDVLSSRALEVGVGRYLRLAGREVGFSVVGVCSEGSGG
ncbi:hypothetical protein LTR62_004074 [Meristemomyces frigidus]|uniref:Ubiquitin carboxyl-terminal hydrolase n=1 Tax=Meristemomyces frigidus TaxID=1508187 RepID=A0AAN7YSF1_9PEZI|nr:hypothetical protein LTR62_004074 [Meristemomyces frigidus]